MDQKIDFEIESREFLVNKMVKDIKILNKA